jgi:hypothetical protein
VDTNLKMSHVTKDGYGAIPDYKDIAEQSKKVAILQVSQCSYMWNGFHYIILSRFRTKSFQSESGLSCRISRPLLTWTVVGVPYARHPKKTLGGPSLRDVFL